MADAFTLPTLEEELGELAGVGLAVDGAMTPAQTDAVVDYCLRIMASLELESQRLKDAKEQSIALIEASYAPKLQKVAARYREFEAKVLELARTADFGRKKKSRELAFGEYGRRASAETIKIVDQNAAVAWCEANGYEALVMTETKIVKKLPHGAVKPVLLSYIARTGEEPAGIEHVAAKDEPFCKPAVAVLAAERGDAREAR